MPSTNIIKHVREEHCVPSLEGQTREEVILEIVQRFVASGAVSEADSESLLKTVMSREDVGTTGIGNGIALPHPQAPEDVSGFLSDVLVGVGLSAAGVDFAAVDAAPVHVVFLVASPDPKEYLQVAKRIAALARDRRWPKLLRQSRTAKAMRELLEEAWESVAP
jgi:mannitol/fructose-specific phosphotransferase system IIA component (Ntr-type)